MRRIYPLGGSTSKWCNNGITAEHFVISVIVPIIALVLLTSCGGNGPGPGPTPITPTATISCNGKTGNCSVDAGATATIVWSSTNTTSCPVKRNGVDTGWGTAMSGSRQIDALMDSATYSVDCTGPNGNVSATVAVTVVPPVRVVFNVLDGIIGQPLANVAVAPSFGGAVSNGAGQVVMDVPFSQSAKFNLDLTVGEYLVYSSTYTTGRAEFKMWPTTGAGPDALWIKQAVYCDASASAGNPGLMAMVKWAYPSVTVILASDIEANAVIVATHRQAYEQAMVNAVNGQISARVVGASTNPSTTNTVPVYAGVKSGMSGLGLTTWTVKNNLITSVKVEYDTAITASGVTVIHESGHAYGLCHHNGPGVDGVGGISERDFSGFEKTQMLMMFIRPAGTVWPDNDRSVIGARATGFTGTIVFRD